MITRYFQILLAGLLTVALAMGCSNDKKDEVSGKKASGPVKYGGVFRMNEPEDFRTLYPLDIVDLVSHHIGSQVYEGLVKFNQKDLSIMPALASSWESPDGATRFVFHLRQDVYFHDDPCFEGGKGRLVKASDIKFCFDRLCSADKSNQQFMNTFKDRVDGANECYGTADTASAGVSGVTMVNDSTIEIKLKHPMPTFLNVLATQGCWIYPKEAVKKYGENMRTKCVGTGPFRLKSIREGESVLLERNPNYWMVDEWQNRLPYLDNVQFRFIKDKSSEILTFNNKELEMIFRLPVEMYKDILGELEKAKEKPATFTYQSNPAMSLTYYGFQNQLKPFDNPKVRLAFNYAIDREKITERILAGDASPAIYGVVPPSLPGYNSKMIRGFTYDPAKAQKLLAEAGYPGGKGFPEITLQINSGGGDRNAMTAESVINQLKSNLGINIRLDVMPFAQHLQTIETGKALFWRTGWNADYPDPETFMSILYGANIPASMSERSSLNSVRYSNPKFDSIFEAASHEPDLAKRTALFMRADQLAMDDGAIMPIYYEVNDRLLQLYVRNFDINPMEFRDMTGVWLDMESAPSGTADSVAN
ncbi:MAG TPA: ABC transporter substrate-binding protein [Bacteroidia bacterium]|nr:ABC transporter substrate-binding protein [Bacteroidia bacterium]